MRANTKTVLKGFDYMHCDDFAKYLGDMAAKGWHFKEWGVGLKFEKGEPEQAVYAVEVFTKASENDMRPEPHTQEFAEYCEAAGWKFIDAKQKFCIFKKVDESAVELFTPEERVTNSFKAMMSGSSISLLVLYGLNAVLQWSNIYNFFERYIFSGLYLFSLSIWNVLFLGQLCTFVYTFWKKRKLQKEIKDGRDIYIGNRIDGKFHFNTKDVYAAILIVLLICYLFVVNRMELIILCILIIGITIGFSVILNKVRPERDTNHIIRIVFSFVVMVTMVIFTAIIIADEGENVSLQQEKLPLLISDYRECIDEVNDIDAYHDRNFFGSVDTYYIFGEEESINYDIYESKHGKILDKIWEELVSGRRFNEGMEDCTGDWEAQQAVRNKIGTYYVRYEDKLLVFSDDVDVYLTVEQIDIIRDKLELR